ncbi:MAG: phosphotransferase family protein [Acidimicrobiia bacterium]|nr:phosphotransferase family protein [Acidimicrobiia bacterium]MDH5288832.1 phosphotransferase family protein [Acidimicrobiia bacterium]
MEEQIPEVDPYADEAVPETDAVRPGDELDWAAIEAHLRAHLPPEVTSAGAFRVSQFPNGSANLTYLIAFGGSALGASSSPAANVPDHAAGGAELVLRRPPFGTIAPGAHDMRREHKVLSRLWQHWDKAPRAYLFCDDHSVAGADFFVMERRRGEVIRGVIPPSMRDLPNVAHRLSMALVDAIAEFHLLDPQTCDLADLGKPDGFMSRQVSGWHKRWELVADERHHEAMCAIHDRLEAAVPEPQRVSLVHNDLKLDNAMFATGDPDTVVAFFDWDMTTLGDPLADLGTLLNYWPDPADPVDVRRAGHDGMTRMGLAPRAEIVARYGERTGFDVSQASWYEAFAQWKTGVVIQQLHHRWKMGNSSNERHATIAESLPLLINTASTLLEL